MSNIVCEECFRRLENCECLPGFPFGVVCPGTVYDPENHNPDICPYCQPTPGLVDEVKSAD